MRKALTVLIALLALLMLPASPALSAPVTHARGSFTVAADFASLALRNGPGGSCVLTVNGTLTFSGTVAGDASGRTTALVFAPCSQVAVTPPGTYLDLFRFRGEFRGTVGRQPVTGPLTYAGVTSVGGAIDAVIRLKTDAVSVIARADAVVAVGGTYAGRVSRTG